MSFSLLYAFCTSCLQVARLDLEVSKCLIRRTQSRLDFALHKFPRSKLYLYCKPYSSGSGFGTSLRYFFLNLKVDDEEQTSAEYG